MFFTLRSTYSKYISTQDTATNLGISQWNILLNDELIKNGLDFSDMIEITYENNEYIAEGFIAPTSTGYFEVALESTGTALPFNYEVTLNHDNSAVEDYTITSYLQYDGTLSEDEINTLKADPNNYTILDVGATTITGDIQPATDTDNDGSILDEKVINKFLVYVSWYDKEDNILDNANDVIAAKTANAKGVINLNLKVTQLDPQTVVTP